MRTVSAVASVVLAISLLTFVLFFGRLPVFRRTPIAWLYRFFAVYVPNAVLAGDRQLTGGRSTATLMRFGRFMMNDKHPTVLVGFVLLLAGSEYMALPPAWSLMSGLQRLVISVVCTLPYVFLYLAAYADPGTVTLGNLGQHMQRYPYDYALFQPGVRCHTCNLLKPPRSKHCPVCKRCVGRLDHHCIFINNCVGVGNHHWFLLLILSTAVLASYGGWVAADLVGRLVQEQFPHWSLLPWRAHGDGDAYQQPMRWTTWLVFLSYGMKHHVRLGSIGLLGLLISPLVWGLLAYSMWNVWTGQTTNESLKWSDWKADMEDGYVYKRRMSHERRPSVSSAVSGMAASGSRWPVEAENVLYYAHDGMPPSPSDKTLAGVGAWEKVYSLQDVENIYDLGFWNNLKDIFVPDYQFNASGLPEAERRGRPRKRKQQK